jgi:2-dehydro-3-deoxyphosphooctonate aldolase (KDO 8-P synthase)
MKLIVGPCVIDENTLRIAAEVRPIVDKFSEFNEVWFKGSYDKANRTSGGSYRGLGMSEGLFKLYSIQKGLGFRVTTDVHEVWQVEEVAGIVDLIQVPALLCRQTDLLVACGKSGRAVSVKKGQFMAPWDMVHVVEKVRVAGCEDVTVIERGTSFGYNRLVVDMTSFPVMSRLGIPTIFDVTHSLQTPCAGNGCSGGSTQDVVPLARAALAAGAGGLFMEVCLDRRTAKCDGPNSVQVDELEETLRAILN